MVKIWITTLVLVGFFAPVTYGVEPAPSWDKETLELFRNLPVQDGGRVKPLDTFAQFRLLKLNGKRSMTTPEGERLSWAPWFLNTLFYPEVAVNYECFIVDNVEVIASIGAKTHNARRSRYSYRELVTGREKLFDIARQYMKLDPAGRTPLQEQIINLANNLYHFEQQLHFFDFARRHYRFQETNVELAQVIANAQGLSLSEVINRAKEIVANSKDPIQLAGNIESGKQFEDLERVLAEAASSTSISKGIDLIPPLDPAEAEWLSPYDLFTVSTQFPNDQDESIEALALLEALPELRDNRDAFKEKLGALNALTVSAARSRGEYKTIPLEVHYYQGNYLFYAQWLFVLSFLIIAFSWLTPKNKLLYKASIVSTILPIVILTVAIVLRCIIRERPPVTTLYETVLFVTAVAATCGVLMELVNRQRIAVAVGAFMGAAGMFLAFRYEAKEGFDTMPSLIAVLDTNFWLTTHVTTVALGYAACLLAAAISHIYILGHFFGFDRNPSFYRTVTRMSYGSICFGLLFAALGTILGGVWANDSWGRFWGWDPKENGALMIVLWTLIIAHARLGGYVRDLGLHVCSIVLGMIVAFSWWGVNNLGVGLHAYGFTEGIWRNLSIFWAIETGIVALGGVVWMRRRHLRHTGGPGQDTKDSSEPSIV